MERDLGGKCFLIPLIPAPLFSTSPENKRTSPFILFSTINFEFLLYFIFSLGAEERLLVKLSLLNLVHALARAEGNFFKSTLCCGLKRRSEVIGKVTMVGLCTDPGRSEGANVLKSKTY